MPLKLPGRGFGKYHVNHSIMKREKLSLGGIKNVLSRAELKKIMAGSGCTGCTNEGLSIPCCQCNTGSTHSPPCPWVNVYVTPNIPFECNCFCIAQGYAYGLNDCTGEPCNPSANRYLTGPWC